MPITGANSVPRYWIDAKAVSSTTDPVATRMYQPRITFSISKPQEVSRSAGHWKRKLRTRNGASSARAAIAVTPSGTRNGRWRAGRAGRGLRPRDGDASPAANDVLPKLRPHRPVGSKAMLRLARHSILRDAR